MAVANGSDNLAVYVPLYASHSHSEGLFISLPVTCVAFCLHYNVPRFYYELRARSLPRMAAVTCASYLFVFVLYVLTAVGGYLLFGQDTVGDVLKNFGGRCTA